jgi:hypothetical protein
MVSVPTLSFCITCKNRIHQLRQTLRKNLEDNRLHQRFIEFVLVDFSSLDGLKEWIVSEFPGDLFSGYLRYYYTDMLPLWHASRAKNTAHFCAKNDIVVNLDSDNFTGYLGGQFVINTFYQRRMDIVCQQYGGDLNDGSFGRISVLRKYFHQIGGYDESFGPMGYQDYDLILRLQSLGLIYVLEPDTNFNKALRNTKEEGLKYTGSEKGYAIIHQENCQKSGLNLAEGYLTANNGCYGIRTNLFDFRNRPFSVELL